MYLKTKNLKIMKNLTVILCIAALTGNMNMAFPQHNYNQKKFKMVSSDNYKQSENDINQDYTYSNSNSRVSESVSQTTGNAYYNPSQSQYTQKDNEIVLKVNALMNVKADNFLIVFNLTQVGETAAKTDELINTRMNNFINACKQLGIADKDIYIDMIYLVPTFEFEVQKKLFSKSYNEIPTGFEMQKNIHISFNDINKIDELVTIAAKNEIYDLVKVDFFVKNTESIYDSLRNKSVENLNKKITSLKKLNLNLSDKYEIVKEYSYSICPETQYPDYDAFVSQSIEALKKESGVTTIRKPETVAYDQIPYNKFDIIINPYILEPVVQFVYSLQVTYTLDKPDVKSNNKYMLITPTGELKNLDIK